MKLAWTMCLVLVACKAKGNGDNTGEPGAFDPPFENTRVSYQVTETVGVAAIQAEVTGSTTVGGEELPEVTILDTRPDATPITAALSFDGPEFSLGALSLPNAPPSVGVDFTLDEVVRVDFAGAIGAPQQSTVDGTLLLGDPELAPETYLPMGLTVTVLDANVVADTPMGALPGCRHASIAADAGGLTATGEVWVRDDVGFVNGFLDTTWGRFDLGMSGYVGFDDVGGKRIIQSERVVNLASPSFMLSTYDIDGDFVADKDTHAQMWLEMRWSDPERARTDEQPLLTPHFGTVFGVFPSTVVRSDKSILHADEDEGFVYWTAFVDQAAKNEPENGIAYSVGATNDGFIDDDVLVGAFIRYARITK